jgi:hypothetical protein
MARPPVATADWHVPNRPAETGRRPFPWTDTAHWTRAATQMSATGNGSLRFVSNSEVGNTWESSTKIGVQTQPTSATGDEPELKNLLNYVHQSHFHIIPIRLGIPSRHFKKSFPHQNSVRFSCFFLPIQNCSCQNHFTVLYLTEVQYNETCYW